MNKPCCPVHLPPSKGSLRRLLVGAAVCLSASLTLCSPARASFSVVVLGCEGGLDGGNLSSYLVSRSGSGSYVALDAGTILGGLRKAQKRGSFPDCQPPAGDSSSPEGWVLRQGIKAYLISHAHVDHVSGLVIDSTDDSSKPLVGLDSTVDYLRDHLFNWKTWPNFGNEGERPIGKYRYQRVQPLQESPLPGTDLSFKSFLLSHGDGGYPSTAFLIRSGQDALLYCGDTGPDDVEGQPRLDSIWTAVAPLVREGRLKGIMLEASFPDGRKDSELFGHLTPRWMMTELRRLAAKVDPGRPGRALRGLPVVVTHIKPSLEHSAAPQQQIRQQLREQNDLGVRFVFPEQGQRLDL